MAGNILSGLSAAQRQRLTESGVLTYEWEQNGVLVDDTELDTALLVLNATLAERKPTQYQEVVEVVLRYGEAVATETKPKSQPRKRRSVSGNETDRQNYINACSGRVQLRLEQAVAEAKSAVDQLYPQQTILFDRLRAQHVSTEPSDPAALRAKFDAEYKLLTENDRVMSVRVASGKLLVFTHDIYATEPKSGTRHHIGRFVINIDSRYKNGGVSYLNLTRRTDALEDKMHAPYVSSDGSPFVSELSETLIELTARFEFATAVELAIQFLETVNDDEAGSMVTRWPVENIDEKGGK